MDIQLTLENDESEKVIELNAFSDINTVVKEALEEKSWTIKAIEIMDASHVNIFGRPDELPNIYEDLTINQGNVENNEILKMIDTFMEMSQQVEDERAYLVACDHAYQILTVDQFNEMGIELVSNLAEWAEEKVCGSENIPDYLIPYIDFEEFGKDAIGDYFTAYDDKINGYYIIDNEFSKDDDRSIVAPAP